MMSFKTILAAVGTAAVTVSLMASAAVADGMAYDKKKAPAKQVYAAPAHAPSTKDESYQPARPLWTGVYLGGNLGGVWVDGASIDGFVPATSSMNSAARALEAAIDNGSTGRSSSILGGLQGGFNVQIGNLVVGLEADMNFFDASSTRDTGLVTVGGFTGQTIDKVKVDKLTTIRPRIGWAFGQTLVYVTGGLAAVHQN